jgi:hypothetical protein
VLKDWHQAQARYQESKHGVNRILARLNNEPSPTSKRPRLILTLNEQLEECTTLLDRYHESENGIFDIKLQERIKELQVDLTTSEYIVRVHAALTKPILRELHRIVFPSPPGDIFPLKKMISKLKVVALRLGMTAHTKNWRQFVLLNRLWFCAFSKNAGDNHIGLLQTELKQLPSYKQTKEEMMPVIIHCLQYRHPRMSQGLFFKISKNLFE